MFKRSFIALLSVVILMISQVSHAKSTLTKAGDILQIAIPAVAFGTATYKKDAEGQKQFAKSFVVTLGVMYAAKYAVKNTKWGERPNGGNYSFPSGHTASAFGGAFFLQKRYGIMYGAPAIALAGLTGYSRVKGKYHHWRDVIGGTVIAAGANYFLVDRYDSDHLKITADIDKTQAMLHLSLDL